MERIKKIKLLSMAKLQAVIFGMAGLVLGFLYSVGGFFIDLLVTLGWVVTSETPGLSYGTILAFGALIGMPLIGLTLGFVTGFIGAILYNAFAKMFGGLRMEL